MGQDEEGVPVAARSSGAGEARLITRLVEMRRAGTITEEEFAERVAAIAGRRTDSEPPHSPAATGPRAAAIAPHAAPSGHGWRPTEIAAVLLVGIVALAFLVPVLSGRPLTASSGPRATSTAAPRGSAEAPTPSPTPYARTWTGQAHPQGGMDDIRVELPAAGDYTLRWQVSEPMERDASGAFCGVTAQLFDGTGSYASREEGVSTIVDKPGGGQVVYVALLPGTYELQIYMGCPWTVSLAQS